jgi:hypothetical protein
MPTFERNNAHNPSVFFAISRGLSSTFTEIDAI